MRVLIFARNLLADEWADELEKKLNLAPEEYEIYNILLPAGIRAIETKADLIIVDTSIGCGSGSAEILKKSGYDEEKQPVAPAQYLFSRLRENQCPNLGTPLVYTSIFWEGEKAGQLRTQFGSYPCTYFFNELAPEGISPLVAEILGIKLGAADR